MTIMAELDVSKPLPAITTEAKPFWDAAAQQKLIIQRCHDCNAWVWTPRPSCNECGSEKVEWTPMSGKGEVYSFTVIRHPVIPNVADALPLVAAVVELPDTGGCRLVGNVVDVDPAAVAIGLPVRVDWYDAWPDATVPVFRLA